MVLKGAMGIYYPDLAVLENVQSDGPNRVVICNEYEALEELKRQNQKVIN